MRIKNYSYVMHLRIAPEWRKCSINALESCSLNLAIFSDLNLLKVFQVSQDLCLVCTIRKKNFFGNFYYTAFNNTTKYNQVLQCITLDGKSNEQLGRREIKYGLRN